MGVILFCHDTPWATNPTKCRLGRHSVDNCLAADRFLGHLVLAWSRPSRSIFSSDWLPTDAVDSADKHPSRDCNILMALTSSMWRRWAISTLGRSASEQVPIRAENSAHWSHLGGVFAWPWVSFFPIWLIFSLINTLHPKCLFKCRSLSFTRI